nr:maleylpyruvate isomerase family mycothiol-dependent enzyme [Mycobacteroides chelonae]
MQRDVAEGWSGLTAISARALVVSERRDLADLLRGLSPEEWEVESLCVGWRVHDVVAHLLYEATPPLRYGYEVLRAGGSADKLNAMYVDRARNWTSRRLLTAFESTIDRGVAARFQPRVALADLLIHHQDIRRPLNRTGRQSKARPASSRKECRAKGYVFNEDRASQRHLKCGGC